MASSSVGRQRRGAERSRLSNAWLPARRDPPNSSWTPELVLLSDLSARFSRAPLSLRTSCMPLPAPFLLLGSRGFWRVPSPDSCSLPRNLPNTSFVGTAGPWLPACHGQSNARCHPVLVPRRLPNATLPRTTTIKTVFRSYTNLLQFEHRIGSLSKCPGQLLVGLSTSDALETVSDFRERHDDIWTSNIKHRMIIKNSLFLALMSFSDLAAASLMWMLYSTM